MKKKLLAILLTVCMVLSMAPAALAADSVFTDVNAGDWFAEEVKYVYDNGLMNGVGDNAFDPSGTVTRAMVWTTLARLDGVDTAGSDPWWLAGQKWAMENGISDGTMATENITREQLVTMIWRYAKYIDMDVSEGEDTNILSYTDAFDVNEWAISAMQWACAVGIINGIDGTLQPQGDASRAMLAAILYRFVEEVMPEEEEPEPSTPIVPSYPCYPSYPVIPPHSHSYTYTPNNDGTHDATCGSTVGICGAKTIEGEACEYGDDAVCDKCSYNKDAVAVIGTTYYTTLTEAVDAAADGNTIALLKNGTYNIPNGVAGKTITIEGTGADTKFDFTKAYAVNDANITFKNLYFQGKNENVMNGFGIQHTTGLIAYENCTFDGAVTNEYFGTVSYKNCTFTGTGYITTYAVKSASFENCVFDKADSRAVLVYSHGDNPCKVTLTECTFKAAAKATTWAGEWTAAVEVDTTNIPTAGTTVTITNCNADENYSGIVRDKSAAGKANAMITVDGKVASTATLIKFIEDGKTEIALAAGSYTMPSTSKDVAITGTKAAKVDLPFGSISGNGNTITFDGVTIMGETNSSWYSTLFNGAKKVIYKNCDIYDQLTTYCDSEFIGCTFYNDFEDDYSVYCYYGSEIKFDACTFNTDCSKAIKVYDENNGARDVYVNNCTFNTSKVDKAAVEIDSAYNKAYNIYFTGTNTINGAYTKLWNDKQPYSNVYIDGVLQKAAATQDALNSAVSDSNTEVEVELAAGSYTMPTTTGDVTISGIKDTVISGNACTADKVTFNGVTIQSTGAAYTGIQHSDEVVYNDVTIIGNMYLYAEKVVFNNCTFDLSATNDYIWVYGATNVEFINCTFNTMGKAILVFQDGSAVDQIVKVEGCTFNASESKTTWNGIHVAAVSIDGSQGGTYNVILNNNTVDSDFNGLWQDKTNAGTITVTVNGSKVLEPNS